MIKQELVDKLNFFFGQKNVILDYEDLVVTFEKNNGATQNDLDIISNKLKIPNDYLDFLQIFNGLTLFKFKDLGGFKFLGTNDISKETEIQRQTYEEDWDNDIIVFCNLICDGDFISFKNKNDGSYEILDCYHDENPQNWKVVSYSFCYFLERLIEEKGKRYWL